MRIGIDFDRVLFDTDAFKQELESRFSNFSDTYSDAKKEGVYSYRKHADILGIKPEKLLGELENAESFVFSDIRQLENIDERVIIVSRGDQKFQEHKINFSGVRKHVDEVVIVQDKPKDSADIDFLVDDTEEELEMADVPGFLFNRPENNLRDVVEKVKKLDG